MKNAREIQLNILAVTGKMRFICTKITVFWCKLAFQKRKKNEEDAEGSKNRPKIFFSINEPQIAEMWVIKNR